jgi:hypothetical protein
MALGPTQARSPALLPLLLLVAVVGCNDPKERAGPVGVPRVSRGLSAADSVSQGLTVPTGVQTTSNDPGTAIVSLTPGNYQGWDQPATIVGIVSGPVQKSVSQAPGQSNAPGPTAPSLGTTSMASSWGDKTLR